MNVNFWRGKRVLLTGHTGFKGSWLLLWLQKLGAEIWTFSLEPEYDNSLFSAFKNLIPDGDNWHHQIGNLSDIESLKDLVRLCQPQVVFHLAAQPLVRRSYQDPLGTWSTNLMGSLNLLESLRQLEHKCAVVMITTDKVYENQEWSYGYREVDRLGGHDPYSASKAAVEIAISSWRASYCGSSIHQLSNLCIAVARSGNVIGGGDWAVDRIVPDAMRSLFQGEPIIVRNPAATRPWQHVIEPLSGYIRLAESLFSDIDPPCEAFNFGPALSSNRSVDELAKSILKLWPGNLIVAQEPNAPHEANLLHLQIDKAYHRLSWSPRWDFDTTIARTVEWYRSVLNGNCPVDCCIKDLDLYSQSL